MPKRTKDFFYKQAKEKGVVARSYYKLEDVDQKYKLVKKGTRMIDIGAAPGSWIQYAQEKIGDDGFIFAVDLNPLNISTLPTVEFQQKNIFDLQPEQIRQTYGFFDLVVSDVAPRTMGHQIVDHTRSYELCVHVLSIANEVLKQNSKLLCKMYQGEQTKVFVNLVKKTFKEVKIIKPDASRKESWEIYILGMGKK